MSENEKNAPPPVAKRYKLRRVSDVQGVEIEGWRYIETVRTTEPFPSVNYSESVVGEVAYLVMEQDVLAQEYLDKVQAAIDRVEFAKRAAAELEVAKRDLVREVGQLKAELGKSEQARTDAFVAAATERDLRQKLEDDLAKVRAHFGSKAFDEALKK